MYALADFALMLWNMGIAAGLMLGAMLVLRPVLLRLLAAQQRTWLGMLGWYGTGMINLFSVLGWIHILPVSSLRIKKQGEVKNFCRSHPAGPRRIGLAQSSGKSTLPTKE